MLLLVDEAEETRGRIGGGMLDRDRNEMVEDIGLDRLEAFMDV